MTSVEHVDVLIVGAGLSGIGAAAQLRRAAPRAQPGASSRGASVSGGTWDLFRYPGVRSDSDMFTFGYRWRPWRGDRALADGAVDPATTCATSPREYGVDRLVRYQHRVVGAAWDSATARWTVEIDTPDGEPVTMTAALPVGCSGYYDYDGGYAPQLPGIERLRRAGGAPAALARGPRLRRQEGGGDRQRRDRGDAGAGDGRATPST